MRPITLLTSEFRILAKVLVKRLAHIVGDLSGMHELVPGRSIHDNLHLIRYA